MSDIIEGADALAKWAQGQQLSLGKFRKFDGGLPQVKFVVMDGGQIYAREYAQVDTFQHPDILQVLGMDVASLTLAGIGRFPKPQTAAMSIKSGTEGIFRTMVEKMKADPGLVGRFKETLMGAFPKNVLIDNQMEMYL